MVTEVPKMTPEGQNKEAEDLAPPKKKTKNKQSQNRKKRRLVPIQNDTEITQHELKIDPEFVLAGIGGVRERERERERERAVLPRPAK